MRELGLKYNNDKVTHHRYDLVYPTYLNKYINQNIQMLEIGLGTFTDGTGYSRDMWMEYFVNPKVFVMDIDHEFDDSIGKVIKGDQSNTNDLLSVSEICGNLDFIIDDGSHHPEHQIKTFDILFQKNLKNGGTYIIEDIECSYWRSDAKVYGYETGYLNIVDFFQKILHQINSEFSQQNNKYKISTITFSKNSIIITKQTDEEIEIDKREYRFMNNL